MPRATPNVGHPQVLGARTDWYAVISSLHGASSDCNTGRDLHMDAIRVRALVGSNKLHILDQYVVASIDCEVAHLTVDRC